MEFALAHDEKAIPLARQVVFRRNQTIIWELEQKGLLEKGVLLVDPDGAFETNTADTADTGTTAGFNTENLPLFMPQISLWLRNFLLDELNVNGHGPPASHRNLHKELKASTSETGQTMKVSIIALMLHCAHMVLSFELENLDQHLKKIGNEDEVTSFQLKELGVEIRNIARIGARQRLPGDLHPLMLMCLQDKTLVGVLAVSVEETILGPYSTLLDRLKLVQESLEESMRA